MGFLAPSAETNSTRCQSIVFFRMCPRDVPYLCLSLCNMFTCGARKNLAEPMEFDAFEGSWIEAFPNGFHASQHRMSVPKCLFLWARNAVEAVNNLARKLSRILRESSRTVCILAFSMIVLESTSAQNGSTK